MDSKFARVYAREYESIFCEISAGLHELAQISNNAVALPLNESGTVRRRCVRMHCGWVAVVICLLGSDPVIKMSRVPLCCAKKSLEPTLISFYCQGNGCKLK